MLRQKELCTSGVCGKITGKNHGGTAYADHYTAGHGGHHAPAGPCPDRRAGRMRNSVRDTWKLEHWDEYVKTIDYSIPEALKKMSSCLDLMLFYNSSDEEYQKSMEMVISRLEDE